MRYTSLTALEEVLLRSGNNGTCNLQRISIPVPNENLKLEGVLCTPRNRSGYYYNVARPKQRIVIHYTAGSLRSDLETLTTANRHVSVPFVIARDGTIYQLYSSKFWSGNLGKGLGNINTGNAQDKCTIAIELSNYGWLTEREGNLETCYSRVKNSQGVPGPVDVYCSLAETQAYQKLMMPFRGQSYYATFSEAQYQSLIILLRYLTATYNIPRQFLPEALRYQTINEVLNFKGIVSHVNYRTDGKWDIGPAFNWSKVIAGVQAHVFNPVVFREAFPNTRGAAITSEEQVEPLLPQAEDAALEGEPYEEVPRTADEAQDASVEKSASKPRKTKLYALLVGVDDYKEDIVLNRAVMFPKLSGCVPDSKRMKTYLENDPAFDADIKLITNEQATKGEIARLFREHLGQAKAGDSALFFFSGHGTQEWADVTTWKEDTDGKLECIVCYYDNASADKLLADKELRYLLHELSQTGAHAVAMFDCCHSGDNTRAVVQQTFSDARVKAIPYVFPKRSWNQFLFGDAIAQAAIKEKGEGSLLPEGAHVQLSACESNEPALEVSGSGVFTKTALQVLKAAGGDVSYQSLGSRVRQYLKNIFEQKPRIYVAGGTEDLINANFLARPSTGQKRTLGELVYNDDRGWKFTLGALHGITEQTKTIIISDPETGETYAGEITAVEIDASYVKTSAKLRKTKTYSGIVEGLFAQPLKVCFNGTDNTLREMQQLQDVLLEEGQHYIVAEDTESEADYVVRTLNDKLYITRPDDPFRPVAALQSIKSKAAAKNIAAQLIHMSQWTFLKDLQNGAAATLLPDNLLQIELTVGNSNTPALDQTGTALITYDKTVGDWEATMQVKLNNTSNTNLYCSALYLTSDFASDTQFLNPPVYLLEPGNQVNLAFEKDPSLILELNNVVTFYNWKEEVEYLKIIMSTEPFDVQALSLEPLSKPPVPGAEEHEARRAGVTRGIRKRTLSGWRTQTITLRLQNPLADALGETEKQAMIADPETSDFAQGLYPDLKRPSVLDKKFGAPAQPTRRDVTVGEIASPDTKRGIAQPKKAKPPLPAAPPAYEETMTEAMLPDYPDGDGEGSGGMSSGSGGTATMERPRSVAPSSPAPLPASTPATRSREGQLEYDIPGQMQTNKSYICKVAIAGIEVAPALMKLGDSSVHAAIRIAEEMSVQLIDCSGGTCFTIVPLSTERQSIDEGDQTRWSFEVTPKQSGNHSLVLKITMHQNGKSKDLDILEKEVLVMAQDAGTAAPVKDGITRILFLAANPSDTTMLRVGAETRQIKEEIDQAKDRGKYLFTTNFAVTTRSLSRAILQEDPVIVHFSGHGEEEGLCLETESGLMKLVETAALDALFKNFADTIQCVVLNACYSKKQATAIAKHIPFVIGMNQAVKDEAALAFSVHFYQALVDGNDIEKSFNLGLAGMAMVAVGDEQVAELLKKS